jgi:hypothetical protein
VVPRVEVESSFIRLRMRHICCFLLSSDVRPVFHLLSSDPRVRVNETRSEQMKDSASSIGWVVVFEDLPILLLRSLKYRCPQ